MADANRPVSANAKPAVDPSAKGRAEGFAALQRNDLAVAEARFLAAITRRSNDADALGGLGLVRLRGQRFAEAAGLLERAARASPGSASRWREALTSARFYAGLQQGQAALNQGRAVEAGRALRPLTGPAYPERAMAQGLLAEALRRQGEAAQAETVYRQILAVAPGQVEAQQGLVQALLDQNRSGEAEAPADQSPAFQLDASGQSAVRGRLDHDRANRLWANGDLSGANTAFEAALAAAPGDPWVRLDFARFLAGQGEAAAAQGLMAPVASSANPEHIQAAALFADQQGRPADALMLINRVSPTQVTPAVAALRSRLEIDAAIQQAQRGGGAGYLRSVATRSDLPVETSGRVAVALYEMGDEQTALALAREALMAGVTEPPASYDGMVTVLARAGRDAEAAALIRQAAARAGSTQQGMQGVADLTATLGAERADRLRQAGVAFPFTGRNGRGGEAAAPPPATTYAPPLYAAQSEGNPFALAPAASDPVVSDIDRQIAELTARTAAEVSGSAKFRTRSGEAGLGKLDELSATASAATSLGGARFTASISPVSIDAGTPGGSAEQRFGANQITNARAIVGAYAPVYRSAGTQSASGAAVNLGVKAGDFAADIGTSPLGFGKVDAAGGRRLVAASWTLWSGQAVGRAPPGDRQRHRLYRSPRPGDRRALWPSHAQRGRGQPVVRCRPGLATAHGGGPGRDLRRLA